jgi:hypothetical protein
MGMGVDAMMHMLDLLVKNLREVALEDAHPSCLALHFAYKTGGSLQKERLRLTPKCWKGSINMSTGANWNFYV